MASWDIYHLTGGAAFELGGTRFTLGLAFAFGSDRQAIGAPGVEEEIPGVVAGAQESKLSYRRFKFILGFAFGS